MTLLIIIIVLAIVFDFINGFHDAANSIATIVTTKVLTPFQAVLWAAVFNFVAFFIAKFIIKDFGIANTVSKTVFEQFITLPIIFSGITAAILWNLATWWFGIPSSSSHTLIGGFMGAALMATHNLHSIHWQGHKGVIMIVIFIFLAPIIGMTVAAVFSIIVQHLSKKANARQANRWFKRLQLVSSALFSIGHGMNDSQKVMGIISVALIAYNAAHPDVLPTFMQLTEFNQIITTKQFDWIPLVCFLAIAVGTMSGGWKIVKTMGSRITKVTPFEGVIAETAGAVTLYLTEVLSIPVSTTHTITGAIIGVGSTKRLSVVRWGVTKNLFTAWLLTIPVSALLAAGIWLTVNAIGIR